MVLVFYDTADVIVADAILFGEIIQAVVIVAENIQSFTRTHPDDASRVFEHLGDIVVGEGLHIGTVADEHRFLNG